MVLETGINGRADAVVTFNRRDYGEAPGSFGMALLAKRRIRGRRQALA